jgi:hypothetical protein
MIAYRALSIQSIKLAIPARLQHIFKNSAVPGCAVAPLLTPQALNDGLALVFELEMRGGLRIHSVSSSLTATTITSRSQGNRRISLGASASQRHPPPRRAGVTNS